VSDDGDWIVEYKHSVPMIGFINADMYGSTPFTWEVTWKRFKVRSEMLGWLDKQNEAHIIGVYRLLLSNIARVVTGKETIKKKKEVYEDVERDVYHWKDEDAPNVQGCSSGVLI
jgi:hypothetical protein